MTMEFDKNCIEMEEKSMGKYLEETVVDSAGWILEFAIENLSSNG